MREALRNDGVCLCADSDRGKKEQITLDVVSRSICLLDTIHDLQGQGRDTLCGSSKLASLGWLRYFDRHGHGAALYGFYSKDYYPLVSRSTASAYRS